MAVEKVSANGFVFAVDTDPDGTPNTTYASIGGIEDFDLSESAKEADITDIDSGGDEDMVIIRRGRTVTVNGHFMEDPGDGTRDAGQAQVEGNAKRVGTASKTYYRVTTPGGTTRTFLAVTTVQNIKGDKNQTGDWSATIKVAGGITDA